jgi:hypothetical protein
MLVNSCLIGFKALSSCVTADQANHQNWAQPPVLGLWAAAARTTENQHSHQHQQLQGSQGVHAVLQLGYLPLVPHLVLLKMA